MYCIVILRTKAVTLADNLLCGNSTPRTWKQTWRKLDTEVVKHMAAEQEHTVDRQKPAMAEESTSLLLSELPHRIQWVDTSVDGVVYMQRSSALAYVDIQIAWHFKMTAKSLFRGGRWYVNISHECLVQMPYMTSLCWRSIRHKQVQAGWADRTFRP